MDLVRCGSSAPRVSVPGKQGRGSLSSYDIVLAPLLPQSEPHIDSRVGRRRHFFMRGASKLRSKYMWDGRGRCSWV